MRLPSAVLVFVLALSACSSGGGSKAALHSDPTPTTAVPVTAPSSAGGTVHQAPGSIPKATAAASSPAAQVVAPPVTTKAPGKPAVHKATAPGTYTLDASGTVTLGAAGTPRDASGTPTLTVSALRGDLQHSTLHGDQGNTDQDLLVRDNGTYGASLKITSTAFTKEFRPAVALLLVPDPATVGSAWSWSASSTDGKTMARATNRVERAQVLTIGGRAVPCAVLVTHLVLSGDVTYDAQITTWWSPDFRLAVKDHTVGQGSYNGFPFKTDITTVMRSVTPS